VSTGRSEGQDLMGQDLTVSLVVPCYNGAATLGRVLDGVLRQTRVPDEVLVVDDGSTDPTAEVARRHGARVLVHGENRGISAARNTGLRAGVGEVVVFLDADAVPHPDLVRRLVQGLDAPGVGAAGGQLCELAPVGVADRWRAHFWRQTQGRQRLADAPLVVGACCAVRRDMALAAGGFAERFRTNGEDVDLSVRLRQRGLRLTYDPHARAIHLRRDTPSSLLRMVYRHSRDQVAALRRHREPTWQVFRNALRWGPVTLVSSLRRHNSSTLALLSPLCQVAALAGCSAGWLQGRVPR